METASQTPDPTPLEEFITPHKFITWTHFDPDGTEAERTGWVWSPAPAVGGMRAVYVLPDVPAPDEPTAVVVVTASRRHCVGRAGETGRGWTPRAGRYVDKGTVYSEAHPSSPTGQAARRPHPEYVVLPCSAVSGEDLAWHMHFGGGPRGRSFPGRVPDVIGGADAYRHEAERSSPNHADRRAPDA